MILQTISIRQPWAGFILSGQKPVENRTWSHPHTGIILIHAGKVLDSNCPCFVYEYAGISYPVQQSDSRFRTGGIVGIAVKETCIDSAKKRLSPPTPWHDNGLFWWPLRDAVPIQKPFWSRGKLGVYSTAIHDDTRLDHPEFKTIADYVKAFGK